MSTKICVVGNEIIDYEILQTQRATNNIYYVYAVPIQCNILFMFAFQTV
jgi:hypothetical protein